jgi:hypothetical protein
MHVDPFLTGRDFERDSDTLFDAVSAPAID